MGTTSGHILFTQLPQNHHRHTVTPDFHRWKVLTITPNGGLPIGIHYSIQLTPNCLRDGIGNLYDGITDSTTWKVATGPVAKPIIRVDKKTGTGNTQPQQTNFKSNTETIGAVISTRWNTVTETDNPLIPSVSYNSQSQPIGAATWAGQKVWIQSYGTLASFTDSTVANEVAIKTVLGANCTAGANNRVYFRGSNNGGGPTTSPGFPIRWEQNYWHHIKLASPDSDSGSTYYLATWAINTPTYFKAVRGYSTNYVTGDYKTNGPDSWDWKSGGNDYVLPGKSLTSTITFANQWAGNDRATFPYMP